MSSGFVINHMDPIIVSINGIKDIEEIDFTDLVPSSTKGRMNVIPNVYVRYDGGKTLTLCSKDKYFDIFIKKVFDVYEEEKDRVIVDPRFNPFGTKTGIKIDEETKRILESGDLTKISEIYSFYDGKKSYDNCLMFQSDQFKMLLPIIKYHLKELFNMTNISISFPDDSLNGYRNNYTLNYKIDGLDGLLLLNIVYMNDNEVALYVRDKDRGFCPIEMVISFNKNDITVIQFFKNYRLHYESKYFIEKENIVSREERVTKDLLPISYKKESLKKVDFPLSSILGVIKEDNMIWYMLPWGGYFGVNDRREALNDVEEIVMSNNKYLGLFHDEFMLREYASKEYRRKKTIDANANKVIMEEVGKRIYGILLDDKDSLYLLETHFDSMLGSDGYYDAYLKEHYFYHIAKSEERLKGIKEDNLHLLVVSSEDDIVRAADLLVKEDVIRLLKR